MDKGEASILFEKCNNTITGLIAFVNNDTNLFEVKIMYLNLHVNFLFRDEIRKLVVYVKYENDGYEELRTKLKELRTKIVELKEHAEKQCLPQTSCDSIDEVIRIIDNMERNETAGDSFNENAIREALEMNKKFVDKDGQYPRLQAYFDRLQQIGAIDKRCSFKLFVYCLYQADISRIVTNGFNSFIRGFMKEFSYFIEEDEEYRNVAAKSFGLDSGSKLGAIGNAKVKYVEKMGDLLPWRNHTCKKKC